MKLIAVQTSPQLLSPSLGTRCGTLSAVEVTREEVGSPWCTGTPSRPTSGLLLSQPTSNTLRTRDSGSSWATNLPSCTSTLRVRPPERTAIFRLDGINIYYIKKSFSFTFTCKCSSIVTLFIYELICILFLKFRVAIYIHSI